jgi:predicted transglutaminase-like cysteine proteinase
VRRRILAAGFILCSLAGCQSPQDVATTGSITPATDHNTEQRAGIALEASRMPKWSAMQSRHRAASQSDRWNRLVAKTETVPSTRIIQHVNSDINRIRYVEDSRNWGQADYWAAPAEFLARGGDCEDFAIAKYLLLREAGVSPSRMRLAIGRYHAVLLVKEDGREFVLENGRGIYEATPRTLSRATFVLGDQEWWVNFSKG